MGETNTIFERMCRSRLVALLSPMTAEECVSAYEIAESEGIVLEIALRSVSAIAGIKAVRSQHPEALVLAGTVMTREQARLAIEAGAAGVVSADYIPEVVEECIDHDVMCIPGGLSDAGKQLAQKAALYGCTLEELRERYPHQWVYKLFPAFSHEKSRMDLASAWRGPFKGLTVLYTGGVSLATLEPAVRADPRGVFCASALTKNLDRPDQMREDIREWLRVLDPTSSSVTQMQLDSEVATEAGPRVVTFGELMLRLSPPQGERLRNAPRFQAHFGGSEANVAASLAGFGLPSSFVTALPANDLGDNAMASLRASGVDTSAVLRQGDRLGVYYLEHGSGVRPSKVVYDRAHSSLAQISSSNLDWERILEGAAWFHWSGITPALGEGPALALRAGLETAKRQGLTVSVDLNFRKKLWSEAKAREVMEPLMSFVDICIGNEEDPTRIFGLAPAGSDVEMGRLDSEGYQGLCRSLREAYGFQKVAITLRESVSASENRWSACLDNGGEFLLGPRYEIPILDRVGTGDAFAGGLIYSLLLGKKDPEALAFAVAAAAWKHSLYGDFNRADVEEIERLAAGDASGRIRR
ncbi:MAG: KHG/KDPG aldolase/sugar kinase fusion protein [Candidatus Aminicenantaceae bacterium]